MSDQTYYETMYILRPDIPEEEVDSHLKKYSAILEKSGTKVLESQMRGKRRLSYPIAKHKEGIYVQLSHQGDGQQVASLERAMRLSEDVIRYLTVIQTGSLPTPKVSSKEDEANKSELEKEKTTTEEKKEEPTTEEKNKTTSAEEKNNAPKE